MTNWAQVERQALAADFEKLGPDVDTLCTGWNARKLAAHVVVRERRPDAAVAGLAAAAAQPLKDYAASVLRGEAQRPWGELITLVRTGPPIWSPLRIEPVDVRVNTVEFFVHHEDLRRAQVGWQARVLSDEQADDLWGKVVGSDSAVPATAAGGPAVAASRWPSRAGERRRPRRDRGRRTRASLRSTRQGGAITQTWSCRATTMRSRSWRRPPSAPDCQAAGSRVRSPSCLRSPGLRQVGETSSGRRDC